MSSAPASSATETTSLRPLRRDAERNRVRILEAAQEVFAARGLVASLDDVAARAGVGVGTLYRRFPTKEALVEALFESRVAQIIDLATASLTAPSGWEGLARFLDEVRAVQAGDRGLREIALSTGYGRSQVAAQRDRIDDLVSQLVARAEAEGTLRSGITSADVNLVLFMVGEVAQNSTGFRPDLSRRYLTLLLDGLRARPDAADLGEPVSTDDLHRFMAGWGPAPR